MEKKGLTSMIYKLQEMRLLSMQNHWRDNDASQISILNKMGGLAPVFDLKSAFSAPSTWMVLEDSIANLANLSSLPALDINLVAITAYS